MEEADMEGFFYTTQPDGHITISQAQEVAMDFLATRSREMFVADHVKAGHSQMGVELLRLEAELLWAARQPENRG